MPINIAPSITPTYDAAINVPSDGEFATSIALQAMVLPLANRIEFLRQANLTDPWNGVDYREDFARVSLAGGVLSADLTWSLAESPQVLTVNGFAPGTNEYGVMQMANNGGSATSGQLVAGASYLPGSFGQIELLSCKVRVGNIVSGMGLEFGMYGDLVLGLGTNPAITNLGWVWQPSVSPNWRLKSSQSGATTFIDSGLPVAVDTWYTLRIDRTAGVFSGRVDAGATHTVIATIPLAAEAGATQFRWIMPNAGATRTIKLDYIYSRFGMSGRVL